MMFSAYEVIALWSITSLFVGILLGHMINVSGGFDK